MFPRRALVRALRASSLRNSSLLLPTCQVRQVMRWQSNTSVTAAEEIKKQRKKTSKVSKAKRAGMKSVILPPLPLEPIPVLVDAGDGTGAETPIPTTALMAEIQEIQDRYPDHILLVQVGGFFEIYDHQGYLEEIADLLHLKIARPKNQTKNQLRFAGFPLARYKDYVEQLVKHGKTVALVEQVGSDLTNKTKTKVRNVTRIITPGTLIDEDWVESRENNFLLSVTALPNSDKPSDFGLAWLDVSTGDFLVCESSLDTFEEHLSRIQPKEILCDRRLQETHPTLIQSLRNRAGEFHLSMRDTEKKAEAYLGGLLIQEDASRALLTDMRKLLADFSPLQVQAAGTLLGYVAENFCHLPSFPAPAEFVPEDVMRIDPVTQQALEITRTFRDRARKGSLLHEIDRTKTAAGSRMLATRLKAPSISIDEINRRLDLVEVFFSDTHLLADVRELLSNCKDVERALQRIHLAKATPGDYLNIIATLRMADQIFRLLESKQNQLKGAASAGIIKSLEALAEKLGSCRSLLNACDEIFDEKLQDLQKITDLEAIKEGISAELDEKRRTHQVLKQQEEAYRVKLARKYGLEDKFKISALADPKLGPILAIQDVRGPSRLAVKARIEKDSHTELLERANTSVGLRFSHTHWSGLYRSLNESANALLEIQKDVFERACGRIKAHTLPFIETCRTIAEIDVASAIAAHAQECGYTRPVVTEELVHDVRGGRHPVVERAQTYRESMYVKNDFYIGGDQRLWLLTGPNMGGKSTFLRQSALLSILAQTGCYVPASSARLGIVDKVFSRVGASDDLAAHQSTFMVEMRETATILKNATEKSFVIMDEIGRGTSTNDGFAIAHATLVYLHQHSKCRGVFATHYHELAARVQDDQTQSLDAVKCYQTAVLADDKGHLIYTYQLQPGVMTQSHGIDCARAAGLPEQVIASATTFYQQLENEQRIKDRLWRDWQNQQSSMGTGEADAAYQATMS
ncbi:DNA mismatch repair protein MutS [Spizellomyces punctatus DAOM BR117]|uniref:DNA mismatch repair protein MSH3 n=1 Tax=Spizellomyces punctatus (strain DAOM BR117) TaxID=645134 RepID=A0A0L0HTU6_SPIPD|nr:DNA mismatch repair protein MutS [Spizellomyces punctatus DAOM BR117]KND04325.1 DNA mismatch repair protein MutS [Spizellomyces punctatus DAOM BR117]|eukprot:XP_016612364.1 DNA mismatch repair protein MutS [Spizellomyces punctatus DAOM BR117]